MTLEPISGSCKVDQMAEDRRTPSTSKEVDAAQASNSRKLHEFTNPVARPKPNTTKQQMTLQQKVTSQKLMNNVSGCHIRHHPPLLNK